MAYIGIKNFGYKEEFLSSLQIFIENAKLHNFPNEFLNEVVDHFHKLKKYNVLQKLILNLNLSTIDISPLLVMCVDLELFNALIYICSKSGDFLTPLIKLITRYESMKKEH